MSEEDDDKIAFDALVETMKRKPPPLALIGAGASMDSGYPDWNGLLRMLEQGTEKRGGYKYAEFLKQLNDPAWQAEEYRNLMDEKEFESLIQTEFGPKDRIGYISSAIAHLGFRHILTTNFDPCIERAYQTYQRKIQITNWTDRAAMRQFFLDLSRADKTPHCVHLHGRYDQPQEIVLTETSYAKRYVTSDDAARKLFAILITQPVVFIGFSVNDPDLNHLMREVNARLGEGTPQHFALMGYTVAAQKQLIKNRFGGKYGIQPVFYRVTTNPDATENHDGLRRLLEDLYEQVHGAKIVYPETVEFKRDTHSAPAPPSLSELPPIMNPLDQQKGRFGGKATHNQRRLKVENIVERSQSNLCTFDVVVEPAPGGPELKGTVKFYLHQTFRPDQYELPIANNEARLTLQAYGAFAIGAIADDGVTRLELDLVNEKAFPQWFRDS